VQTGGAPPSPQLLDRLDRLNFNFEVTHLYGLTETFGPVAINEWRASWTELDGPARATLQARQGFGNLVSDGLRVVDIEGNDVRRDGSSIGEILVRGNSVMLGYYQDKQATEAAMQDGWLRTGDLGVHHPDGYIEIRDRAKDVIISGGENIASVEIERVIDSHPDVVESAVIGVPDETWGQVPHAFITLRGGATVSEDDVKAYIRAHLAGFKVPKKVHFVDLPKTSTGKIQKQLLKLAYEHPASS
jgi:fatty-acyl-CoA synthase